MDFGLSRKKLFVAKKLDFRLFRHKVKIDKFALLVQIFCTKSAKSA